MRVSQNVAYDAVGHCYYLEDGVEEHNRLEHNLAAHVHVLTAPARASSHQFLDWVDASDGLILPADVAASGFYVTNANNRLVGNAASGGWSGYSFPELRAPVKLHRHLEGSVTPSARPLLEFAGNSAHSAGFWWFNAGLVYFGGKLEHAQAVGTTPAPIDAATGEPRLRYNPGRAWGGPTRRPLPFCARAC